MFTEFPSLCGAVSFEALIEMIPVMQPRHYSIASSSWYTHNQVSATSIAAAPASNVATDRLGTSAELPVDRRSNMLPCLFAITSVIVLSRCDVQGCTAADLTVTVSTAGAFDGGQIDIQAA